MYPTLKTALFFAAAISIIACRGPNNTTLEPSNPTDISKQAKSLAAYPLRAHFNCLPETAAILAAHRGTSKNKGFAENGRAGLKALIEKGILIAEIDIAKTKDGIHFLFHDGVWDDETTGKGVVASTSWKQAQKFLLKDSEGRLTSETLVHLDEYLDLAKGQIYLEIDFKSSANYEQVIQLIRAKKMASSVILISYSEGQARKLARLAPDMMISVSVRSKDDLRSYKKNGLKINNIAAWTGRNGPSKTTAQTLKDERIPILVYPAKEKINALKSTATLIVTDYALDQKPIIGKYDKKAYKACLNQ